MGAKTKKYTMSYRPDSYFDIGTADRLALSQIKGHARRRIVKDMLDRQGAGALHPGLLSEDLAEPDKIMIGRTDPQFLGGEYLPDTKDDEVEIVRIVFIGSTTCDVQSIRAKRDGERLRYRLCDDMECNLRYAFSPKVSAQPLAMREMIDFIDTARVVGDKKVGLVKSIWREMVENGECDPGGIRNFIEVQSDFYPEIKRYYKDEEKRHVLLLKRWLSAQNIRRAKKNKRSKKKPWNVSSVKNKIIGELSDDDLGSLAKWLAKTYALRSCQVHKDKWYGSSLKCHISWQEGKTTIKRSYPLGTKLVDVLCYFGDADS